MNSNPYGNSNFKSNALLISYLFPPVGGIGVQRPLKFVRYLGLYGWNAYVLTTSEVYSATMDEKLLQQIPETVQIKRKKDIVSKWIGRFISSNASTTAVSISNTSDRNSSNVISTLKKRLGPLLKQMKDTLLIPDESVLWAIQAAWAGRHLVKKNGISCIYTTSGPNSTHLAGLLISRWTGVQWVADFRDPWIDNMHFNREGFRKAFEIWMEKQVFHHAHSVITVTDSFRELFINKYPEKKDHIHVIRNGVDPNDYPDTLGTPSWDSKFTIFYAGILYPERSPSAFFQALSDLTTQGKIPADDIRIQFAGVFDYPGKRDHQDLLERFEIQSMVELLGYLPHEEVLHYMANSHALLLIGEVQAQSAMYVPGKLYEYLYAKRPILGIMQEGEGANIIRQAKSGIVMPPNDANAIASAILSLYESFKTRQPFTPDEHVVHQYSRIEQTRQLAELMQAVQSTHS